MTLPASFPISASQINVELGRASNAPFDIQGAEERDLAGVPSGAISMSDFLGKPVKDSSFIERVNIGSGINPSGTINTGVASVSRRIVVAVHWVEGGVHATLSSATIGGIAATIHVQRGHNGGSTGLGVAIISAVVPTGTSSTLQLNFSSGVTGSNAGVFRLIGYTLTAVNSDQSTGTTAPLSANVATSASGVVIAGYTGSTNTVGTAVNWSSITEQYDVGSGVRVSGAFVGVNAGSLTVGASQGVILSSGNDLCVSSWG